MTGKSIALTPDPGGSGQVTVQGTFHTAGNIVAGGGAHFDGDLSFVSATCPGRIERSRVGSGSDQSTGPAQWSTNAATNGLKDFLRKLTLNLADPTSIMLSPRGMQNLQQEAIALLKKSIPLETQPTGLIMMGQCIVTGTGNLGAPVVCTNVTPIPIYNFPHHHSLADGAHSHDSFVPNVKLVRTSEELRKGAKTKENLAPVGISEPGGNIFQKMGQSILGLLGTRLTP
jgi:hypothetical protein